MNSRIKVVVKTFEVLEILNKTNKLSLKEITARVIYPKATVFRLLNTLRMLGYVEQEPDTLNYVLSSKFMSFAKGAITGSEVTVLAKPRMEELRNEFKETINLAKLVGTQAIYVHILESNHSFRISDSIGDRASFHSTAIGKAIIAFLPEEKREEIIKNCSFTKFTKKTITSIISLRSELQKVKSQGYSVDDEEGHEGVVCIGAPIFNKNHLPFAALSISMPKVRAKKIILDRIKRELPKAGVQISLDLGVTDIGKCFNN